MSELVQPSPAEELQFERVVPASTASTGAATGTPAALCQSCQRSIQRTYYQVNGKSVCYSCTLAVQAAAESPTGMASLLKAATFGFGAGVVGATIYYGVIALANLEIGIVAILIGYMVGFAVRKGAGGGGRRFQYLAVALTYGAVALAYTPLAIQGATGDDGKGESAITQAETSTSVDPAPDLKDASIEDVSAQKADAAVQEGAAVALDTRGTALALAVFLGLILSLPVLVVIGSMPSGLISALIIFFGMRQAWSMTGAPTLVVNGPYQVGTPPFPAV